MRLAAVLALLALAGAQAAPSTPGQVIIRPEIPALTTIAPTSGLVGSSVVLTGNNFGPAQENSLVTFNGAPAVTIAWSNTSITALVPPAGTTGPVVVVRGGVSTVGLPFTVIPSPPPTLTSLTITSGPVGTPLTVIGTNFGATQGTSVLTFNGIVATPTSWSATSIVTTVPVGATTGPVHVVVLGQTSNNLTFTVTVAPVLTSLNLNSGPIGTPVTLTGLHFGAVQNSSLVFFNGVPATSYAAWSDTSVTTAVPAGATTGLVTILVLGVTSNGITFTVTTGGSTFVAASCNWQDVVNAENLAYAAGHTSPATVIIPAGTCTDWPAHASAGAPLISTADGWPVTLQGAGGTATTIDVTAANGQTALYINAAVGARVTGIRFLCGQVKFSGSGVRIDHNTFECHQHNVSVYTAGVYATNTNASGANQLSAPLKGLIDNNHFIDMRVLVFRFGADGNISENGGATVWSDALGLGTDDAVYVEDNDFHMESFQNAIDCEFAGKFVFRYNTVVDTYLEMHPARGQARGCRKWEIYNDTLTQSVLSVAQPFSIRGGTGVMFGTRWTGTFGDGNGQLAIVRAVENLGPGTWLGCDGTSPWDGNQDATGWPCLDQPGRGGDFGTPFNGSPPPYSPPPQLSVPAYFWDNLMNGAQLSVVPHDAPSAARLMINRDYFVSPSTAMPGYTPYTYPHPLQGPPTLTSLSTTSGPVGTTVTLTGRSWGARQNASVVRFNGSAATVTAWSTTSITVTVPVGATTGAVTVTVNGTPTNGMTFTVM
jgi:hypothetical protein